MAPPPPPPPPDDLVQDIAHPPFASTRSLGLGVLAVLPDELVTAFLTHCSAAELDRLSQCSRALFVFARDDLLWRNVCLCLNAELRFQGSWRMTFLAYWEAREVSSESDGTQTPPRGDRRLPPLDLASWDFRSHYLHDRWLRSCLDPAMLPLRPDGNRVPTLDPANPADVEQIKRHVRVGLPFVLSASATSSWEARTEWHPDALRSKYGSIQFRIGAGTENNTARSIRHVDMRLDSYLDYCARQNDESPLYLFDAEFGSRAPSMLKEYLPFDLFESDLMSALEPRPMDFRWLVVGPPRSGAGWHCDPLGTSAWNALLFGQKRWAVYPPDVPPPEVLDKRASLDWFLDVYPQLPPQSMPFEFLQNEGETVFVPAGWCVRKRPPSSLHFDSLYSSQVARHPQRLARRQRRSHPEFP